MNKFKTIIITVLCLTPIILIGFMSWFFSPKVPKGSEPIPKQVFIEKKSPDGSVVAQILQGGIVDGFNPLGSDARFYLCLNFHNVKHLILYDLSEGFGTYEGGITDLEWNDSKHIRIKRIIGDQQSDIVYDLVENKWQFIENETKMREQSLAGDG